MLNVVAESSQTLRHFYSWGYLFLLFHSDLEKSVEELQRNSSVNHGLVTEQEVEQKSKELRMLGETLAELKSRDCFANWLFSKPSGCSGSSWGWWESHYPEFKKVLQSIAASNSLFFKEPVLTSIYLPINSSPAEEKYSLIMPVLWCSVLISTIYSVSNVGKIIQFYLIWPRHLLPQFCPVSCLIYGK